MVAVVALGFDSAEDKLAADHRQLLDLLFSPLLLFELATQF